MTATLRQPPQHHTPTTTPAPPRTPAPVLFAELERVLIELRDVHERMLEVVREHRKSVSAADLAGISRAIARQGDLAGTVAAIDQRRAQITASLTSQLTGQPTTRPPGQVDNTRLSHIIALAPTASRDRLSAIAAVLRDVLTRLHSEQQALKLATETLAQHMEGVMRQIYRGVSHTGTYVRSGKVDTAVQVITALDVQT